MQISVSFVCFFVFFTVKSLTQRSVSQENACKKAKSRHFYQSSNNSLFLFKHFRIFKIAKFEFKVTTKNTLWPMDKMHLVVSLSRIGGSECVKRAVWRVDGVWVGGCGVCNVCLLQGHPIIHQR